eukprot:6032997-Amphidinium_carterae.1
MALGLFGSIWGEWNIRMVDPQLSLQQQPLPQGLLQLAPDATLHYFGNAVNKVAKLARPFAKA